MNGSSTSATLVTPHYDLHCQLSVRGNRALELFNDASKRFLSVEDVRFHPHCGDSPLLDVSQTLIVKENVHLVILDSEDRSKESRFYFAARERRTFQTVISLPLRPWRSSALS